MVLVFIVTIVGITAELLLVRKMPIDTGSADQTEPLKADLKPDIKIPIYEVFPPPQVSPSLDEKKPASSIIDPDPIPDREKRPSPAKKQVPPKGHSRPKVVIIIDDIGYNRKIVDQFLSLDLPLTFSVLPFSPHQQRAIKKVRSKNREIMLHLPMEPKEYPKIDPGPGALLTAMTPEELTLRLYEALDTIPQAVGVNNHMGSRVTTNTKQMYQILSILKQRGLFFIDSKTANKTVTRDLARTLKLPYAQRTIFLDNQLAPEKIKKQLMQLVQVAKKRGVAIGIGHPHEETYRVLARELPHLKRQVQIVTASRVVRVGG